MTWTNRAATLEEISFSRILKYFSFSGTWIAAPYGEWVIEPADGREQMLVADSILGLIDNSR